LDTIDYSNLNRQFLFGRDDVGKSKAQTARLAALRVAPHAEIKAHHANVSQREFDVDYIQRFKVVMNALDNLQARRHVNRLCMLANVPLIESGTAGYLGQCQVHVRGVSECFDCHPKPQPAKHPTCTIRSQPTKFIHCVVWGKHLFNLLYGEHDSDNPLLDGDEKQAGANDPVVLSDDKLFAKVFHDDVAALAAVDRMWRDRQRPQPLTLQDVVAKCYDSGAAAHTHEDAAKLTDGRVWSPSQCAERMLAAMARLSGDRLTRGCLDWDKDVDDHLDFVTAAANLRALCFHIPMQSRFHVKCMLSASVFLLLLSWLTGCFT